MCVPHPARPHPVRSAAPSVARGAVLAALMLPPAGACPPSPQVLGPDTPSSTYRLAPVAGVRLQGCVVDAGHVPRATAVHALSAEGRLLSTGWTDAQGVFRMQVPAGRPLRLVLGTARADARAVLHLPALSRDEAVEGCVIDLTSP